VKYLVPIGIAFFLVATTGMGIAGPLPTYTIQRAVGPIAIDGILDEPDWEAAVPVGDFVFPWWAEGEQEQTLARILWDDTNLYVGFVCQDAYIWAEYTNRDDPVSRDDCAEVFVSPNPDDVQTYFNIEINVIGTVLDRGPYSGRSATWTAEGLRNAAAIEGSLNDDSDEDRYWTMEIAIPFKVFEAEALHTPPEAGDEWRLNLNRCGGETNPQYSQWSSSETTKPSFHVPERFGSVYFSAESVSVSTPVSLPGWGALKRRWFERR